MEAGAISGNKKESNNKECENFTNKKFILVNE